MTRFATNVPYIHQNTYKLASSLSFNASIFLHFLSFGSCQDISYIKVSMYWYQYLIIIRTWKCRKNAELTSQWSSTHCSMTKVEDYHTGMSSSSWRTLSACWCIWIAPFSLQMSVPTFTEISSEQIRLKACGLHLHCYSPYKSNPIVLDLIVIIVHSTSVWEMLFRVSRIIVLQLWVCLNQGLSGKVDNMWQAASNQIY